MVLLMVVEVVLVLGPPKSPPKTTILAETGNIGDVKHHSMGA